MQLEWPADVNITHTRITHTRITHTHTLTHNDK